MTEAEALVAKLKAERAVKLAKAMNGRAEGHINAACGEAETCRSSKAKA